MTQPAPEPEALPVETTDVETLWRRISFCGDRHPTEELRQVIALRHELVPLLLETLENVIADPESSLEDPDFHGHEFALLLLAQFREARAFPLILRFISHPDVFIDDLIGDTAYDGLPAVLASTCNGDVATIKSFVEDGEVDDLARRVGIAALAILVAQDLLARSELIAWIGELMGRLPRQPDLVWDEFLMTAADLRLEEHREALDLAFRDGLVHRELREIPNVDAFLAGRPHEALDGSVLRLIDDAVEESRHLTLLDETPFNGDEDAPHYCNECAAELGVHPEEHEKPFMLEQPKVGRNDPCPCGTGKKFKKCCGK